MDLLRSLAVRPSLGPATRVRRRAAGRIPGFLVLGFFSLIALSLSATVALATTYIVTPDGTGDYPTIQDAIYAAVDGDVVELTDGTFTGVGNRDINFLGKAITIRSQSGDSSACIIDCEQTDRGFRLMSGEGSLSVLDGLTIANGFKDYGGGIFCVGSSPSIRGCVFRNDSASVGGGIYCNDSSPVCEQCVFVENSANYGAGISCLSGSSPSIAFCTFAENEANYGAGISCRYDSSPSLINCTFFENSAPSGGGVFCEENSIPTLANTIIAFSAQGRALRCPHDEPPTLTCCDLYGNVGGDWVGAIEDQYGTDGNISEDPLFCGPENGDFTVASDSPCAPFAPPNEDCELIGAWPFGCDSHTVNPEGTGDFPTIQAAIDGASDGDAILLTSGTFTGEGNRDIDFRGKAVAVVAEPGVSEPPVIDCEQSGRGFIFASGEGPGSRLRGIIVTNGLADCGGAIHCAGAAPTISSCTLVGNSASTTGGAIACASGASPSVSRCTLSGNAAAAGGGIGCTEASAPAVTQTIISFSMPGEAVSCDATSSATLACCDVFGNAGGDWVGCIATQYGISGNISADPLFCGPGNFALNSHSPCAPFSPPNEECDLIGAWPVACNTIIVVHPDGTGDYPTIQDAIYAALDGDVVELTDGTFTDVGNRDINFLGKAITVRSQSGDSSACIIDCEDSARGFHFDSGEGNPSILRGVTITRGRVSGYTSYGGGILCDNSSAPTITNCVLVRNHADFAGGGAACRSSSSPTFSHCIFSENTCAGEDYGAGGGIYCGDHSNPVVSYCTFSENYAHSRGGGIDVHLYSEPAIMNCTFYGNISPNGSGIGCRHHGRPEVQNTIITRGGNGAAVFCMMDSDPVLYCCDVFGNIGGDWVDCIADQYGIDGNICADPLFCDAAGGDLTIYDESPCAPFTPPNEECDLIGAWRVGCEAYLINPEGTGDFPTIQAAIDALGDGDIILLAPGVFTGEGNRNVDFLGKALTVRGQSELPEQSIVDCEHSGRGFIFASAEGPGSVLRNVVVRNGLADLGGAVFCSYASPTLIHCTFSDLEATTAGGAIYVAGASTSATFDHCTFARNTTATSGGALLCLDHATPTLTNCTFVENAAPLRGGGLYCGQWSSLTMDHSIIAFASQGEAVYCDETSDATLTCCDVFANEGGDWVGCLAGQYGVEGNIAEDPLFCGPEDYTLDFHSPCQPFTYPNPECDLIGAWGEGCHELWTYLILPDGTGDFPTIQEAINWVAAGDTILLADGVFTGEGNRDIDYLGKAIVVRSQSGNPEACVIDCQHAGRGFIFQSNEGTASVLQGVTITNGNTSGFGAGIACREGTSPRITDCIISGNSTDGVGGGISCFYSSSVIVNECVLSHNTAGVQGGGLYAWRTSAQVTACTFADNYAGIGGGGICLRSSQDATVTGCTFSGNAAGTWGGGVSVIASSPVFTNCVLLENSSGEYGGGVHCAGSWPTFTGCTLAWNEAVTRGGGFDCDQDSNPRIRNCTFYGNFAVLGSGVGGDNDSSPSLENTIIACGVGSAAVDCENGSSATLTCCDLFGNMGGDWVGCIEDQCGVGGNISAAPLFCNAENGNFAISDQSPCAPQSPPNPECDLIGAWPVGCQAHLVNAEGTGDFPTIQAAIDGAADGDLILLAAGTFTGEGNRDIDFRGRAVTVMGQESSPDQTIIDCQGSGRGFVFTSEEGPGSGLHRITITNAVADSGAAVYCSHSSPAIAYCALLGNAASEAGGGIHVVGAQPTISYCTFAFNTAGASGGGIHCADGARPTFANCTFAYDGGTQGGGLYCAGASSVVMEQSIIAFATQGAAVACDGTSDVTLTCCDVYGNEGGDWVGCIEDQYGTAGNIAADPLFCGPEDFTLEQHSPCLPFTPPNGECGLVGAWGQGCLEPTIYLVRPDGTGDFPTIQAAIDAGGDGDIVELANGIFTGAGNINIDFHGKAITVRSRSGDPSACVIDCENSSRAFHFHSEEDSGSVVREITITRGAVFGHAVYGGGVLCESYSSPTLTGCVFVANHADYAGAALACRAHCSPTLTRCVFSANTCAGPGYGQGGGMYCGDHSDPLISYCTFSENHASVRGGGIDVHMFSQPTITNCTLTANIAPNGSGIGCRHHAWPQIQNTIIAFGEDGAGVFCEMESDPVLTCCDLFGNEGGDWVDCIAEQYGLNGNISEDPLFCGDQNPEEPLRLQDESPCGPFTPPNPECDLIGAWPVGCEPQQAEGEIPLPRVLSLGAPAPNPFGHAVRMTYGIPATTGRNHVGLRVYDLTGRLIRTLIDADLPPNWYVVTWDGTDNRRVPVPSGVYFCRLRCGSTSLVRRLVLVD